MRVFPSAVLHRSKKILDLALWLSCVKPNTKETG